MVKPPSSSASLPSWVEKWMRTQKVNVKSLAKNMNALLKVRQLDPEFNALVITSLTPGDKAYKVYLYICATH